MTSKPLEVRVPITELITGMLNHPSLKVSNQTNKNISKTLEYENMNAHLKMISPNCGRISHTRKYARKSIRCLPVCHIQGDQLKSDFFLKFATK